jgi:hypothetical protein
MWAQQIQKKWAKWNISASVILSLQSIKTISLKNLSFDIHELSEFTEQIVLWYKLIGTIWFWRKGSEIKRITYCSISQSLNQ